MQTDFENICDRVQNQTLSPPGFVSAADLIATMVFGFSFGTLISNEREETHPGKTVSNQQRKI
eukprot:4196726-Amphidinium_carterae.1